MNQDRNIEERVNKYEELQLGLDTDYFICVKNLESIDRIVKDANIGKDILKTKTQLEERLEEERYKKIPDAQVIQNTLTKLDEINTENGGLDKEQLCLYHYCITVKNILQYTNSEKKIESQYQAIVNRRFVRRCLWAFLYTDLQPLITIEGLKIIIPIVLKFINKHTNLPDELKNQESHKEWKDKLFEDLDDFKLKIQELTENHYGEKDNKATVENYLKSLKSAIKTYAYKDEENKDLKSLSLEDKEYEKDENYQNAKEFYDNYYGEYEKALNEDNIGKASINLYLANHFLAEMGTVEKEYKHKKNLEKQKEKEKEEKAKKKKDKINGAFSKSGEKVQEFIGDHIGYSIGRMLSGRADNQSIKPKDMVKLATSMLAPFIGLIPFGGPLLSSLISGAVDGYYSSSPTLSFETKLIVDKIDNGFSSIEKQLDILEAKLTDLPKEIEKTLIIGKMAKLRLDLKAFDGIALNLDRGKDSPEKIPSIAMKKAKEFLVNFESDIITILGISFGVSEGDNESSKTNNIKEFLTLEPLGSQKYPNIVNTNNYPHFKKVSYVQFLMTRLKDDNVNYTLTDYLSDLRNLSLFLKTYFDTYLSVLHRIREVVAIASMNLYKESITDIEHKGSKILMNDYWKTLRDSFQKERKYSTSSENLDSRLSAAIQLISQRFLGQENTRILNGIFISRQWFYIAAKETNKAFLDNTYSKTIPAPKEGLKVIECSASYKLDEALETVLDCNNKLSKQHFKIRRNKDKIQFVGGDLLGKEILNFKFNTKSEKCSNPNFWKKIGKNEEIYENFVFKLTNEDGCFKILSLDKYENALEIEKEGKEKRKKLRELGIKKKDKESPTQIFNIYPVSFQGDALLNTLLDLGDENSFAYFLPGDTLSNNVKYNSIEKDKYESDFRHASFSIKEKDLIIKKYETTYRHYPRLFEQEALKMTTEENDNRLVFNEKGELGWIDNKNKSKKQIVGETSSYSDLSLNLNGQFIIKGEKDTILWQGKSPLHSQPRKKYPLFTTKIKLYKREKNNSPLNEQENHSGYLTIIGSPSEQGVMFSPKEIRIMDKFVNNGIIKRNDKLFMTQNFYLIKDETTDCYVIAFDIDEEMYRITYHNASLQLSLIKKYKEPKGYGVFDIKYDDRGHYHMRLGGLPNHFLDISRDKLIIQSKDIEEDINNEPCLFVYFDRF